MLPAQAKIAAEGELPHFGWAIILSGDHAGALAQEIASIKPDGPGAVPDVAAAAGADFDALGDRATAVHPAVVDGKQVAAGIADEQFREERRVGDGFGEQIEDADRVVALDLPPISGDEEAVCRLYHDTKRELPGGFRPEIETAAADDVGLHNFTALDGAVGTPARAFARIGQIAACIEIFLHSVENLVETRDTEAGVVRSTKHQLLYRPVFRGNLRIPGAAKAGVIIQPQGAGKFKTFKHWKQDFGISGLDVA